MYRKNRDIIIAAALAVLACVAIAAHLPGPVVVVLGVCLFAAPGYVWSTVLLSGRVSALEHVLAATGIALIVPILGGMLLYGGGISLHRGVWVGLLAGMTLAGAAVLAYQRRGAALPAGPAGKPGGRRRMSLANSVAFGTAGVIAVGAIGLSVVSAQDQKYPGYTQLWLQAAGPTSTTASLGVLNQEGKTETYRLVLMDKGKQAQSWNITLANGQTWQRTVPYTLKYSEVANLYLLPNVATPYRKADNGE